MSGAEEESRYVVVVTELMPLRIVLLDRAAADIALRTVLMLFSLLSSHTLYRSICPEFLYDRRLPLADYV